MAKVKWRQAKKDDPIFTGGFILSSPLKRRRLSSTEGQSSQEPKLRIQKEGALDQGQLMDLSNNNKSRKG